MMARKAVLLVTAGGLGAELGVESLDGCEVGVGLEAILTVWCGVVELKFS